MIGNDVIDLTLAVTQSNWQRKGFMDKLFTISEQQEIMLSSDPEKSVWIYWSMKEAVYKIYNRQSGERGFFPGRLICHEVIIDHDIEGKVVCNGTTYYCRTTINNDLLHTVAVSALSDFNKINIFNDAVIIKDTSGLPFIEHSGILIPVSKSHHGKYQKTVSFAV